MFFAILTLLFHTAAALPLPQENVGLHKKAQYNVMAKVHGAIAARAEKKMISSKRKAIWNGMIGNMQDAAAQGKSASNYKKKMEAGQKGVDKYRKKLGKGAKPNIPT